MFKSLAKNFLILIVLFSPFFAFGQFKGGFSVGINTSSLSGNNSSGFRQFGFSGGPVVEYILDEQNSLQFEILFSQKGARKPQRPEIGDLSFYFLRLNYFELPFLFKHLHNQFVFEAGPSVSVLINSKEEDGFGPLPVFFPFRPFELAANLGITYHLNDNFDMNWRFTHSIIPVRQHLSGSTFRFNRGQYNAVLSFRLLYYFSRSAKDE
jgi:hypothetical protein